MILIRAGVSLLLGKCKHVILLQPETSQPYGQYQQLTSLAVCLEVLRQACLSQLWTWQLRMC